LPKMQSRVSIESLMTGSIGLLAVVIFTMGIRTRFTMGSGGVAYITILSKLYTIGMKSAPKWIGARILAVYMLVAVTCSTLVTYRSFN
jgi:Transmembrane secretion effector